MNKMENKKLLYQLEYEVAELRKRYLNYIDTNEITLKEVLDLGFNNTYINLDNIKVGIYKDENGNYVANGYFLTNNFYKFF